MRNFKMTEQEYWDNYWNAISLPKEIKKTKKTLFINEILEIFDEYLPYNDDLSILEIGGSPGQYLAYMYKNFGYEIHCLDYSGIGCMKTKENLGLLAIPVTVYQKDLFSQDLNLPLFDIIYSLGFIEHFLDPSSAVRKHCDLLKPGGILLMGVPNFLGIYKWFLQRLAPQLLSKHNLKIMDINNWKRFEDDFNLIPLFTGYVGGFEPSIFNRCEKKTVSNYFLLIMAKAFVLIFKNNFKILRKNNSRCISGYTIGVYKKAL